MYLWRIASRHWHAFDFLVHIFTYRLLRATKWKIYRRRMIRTRRGKLVRKVLLHAIKKRFWKLPSTRRYTSVSFPRRGYTDVEDGKVYWESPLGVTVWNEHGPVCSLGVEYWNDTLCIRQLQGVAGARAPSDFKDWPRVFVDACVETARRMGMRRVRLYRADQSLFYSFPSLEDVPNGEYDRVVAELRNRMRRRYDGTARQMGFAMKRRWGEWVNPKRVRSR